MENLRAALKLNNQVSIGGLASAAWAPLAAHLYQPTQPLLIIAPDAALAPPLTNALQALGLPAQLFPGWDVQPYDRLGPSPHIQGARAATAQLLSAGQNNLVIVTSLAALAVRQPPASGQPLVLQVGQEIALTSLTHHLTTMGYAREEVVEQPGSFAIRGGIVDVWPAALPEPLRLELFDTTLESLRSFNPNTQQSSGQLTTATILPHALALTETTINTFRTRYRELFPQGTQDELYIAISAGILPPEAGQFQALLHPTPLPTLLAQLPANTLVLAPHNLSQQAQGWDELVQAAHAARHESYLHSGGTRALPPALQFVSQAELLGQLSTFRQLTISPFVNESDIQLPLHTHQFAVQAGTNRHAATVAAAKAASSRHAQGYSVLLTATSAPALNQFLRAMEAEGMPAPRLTESPTFQPTTLSACTSLITNGWIDTASKTMVITDADVFGTRAGGIAKSRKRSAEDMLAHFSQLTEGDYVVHEAHGIGRFGGLVTMQLNNGAGGQGAQPLGRVASLRAEGAAISSSFITQDFLKIFYADEDRLFVPVENLDVLSRYKGAEAGAVTLDKLGTGGWQVRKDKVKVDLLAMADELLKTAAERELATRPPLERGIGLYDEFCAGFPWPLTEDQQKVMDEVEADLTSGTPMDRLVVGDVGFGKTEVALRAAFLVAASGRQVAVVCPTTLLARQHYAVFAERFAGFPMKIGRLSRLVSSAETKRTKQALANGEVDIVVGTHALLSKDIEFQKLGLVVVDEEQRFGVAHKEKLKTLRAETDLLTLTATPIPRTLQLAVGGVRQLSLITTPPVDRHAVQTFVQGWDNLTLKGAITRELVRGGQVYVVAPHVEDLPKVEKALRELVPEARLAIAHGQMAESNLEAVMEEFYEGKLDVLLATTIIESGLDVPRANTLIVYRADRFGLAQLYQLRGRVGRSTAQAFAYFLLPEGHVGAEATKRLNILQRLDGLGAGFMLASYDMDLRGFGNLLGKQQSGNIRDIGFELYAKMLKDAVNERQRRMMHLVSKANLGHQRPAEAQRDSRREETLERRREEGGHAPVTLKLTVSYLIPEDYVRDVTVRLQLYRRLANLHSAEQVAEFEAELRDRFGPPPAEVTALLQVVNLRNRAAHLNISKLEVGEKGVVVAFHQGRFANPAGLVALLTKLAGVLTLRPSGRHQELVWHRRLHPQVLKGTAVILTELESALTSP
ncbi:MAG: transcription-repair coupling factor [Proteobacteria bacterium]|nr:transcription-repair coupling factor [Pseudomonadota bacterium]